MTYEKKRVYALYRVSTTGQVEKDDIPMQRQYCREFADAQGWEIVQEFSEKGVSGFKVSAKDRDAIQEIQQDAAIGKFDILLVFMFDRIGRREDETPFVVEWFVKNGIEVWSAHEGQQRFDNHVDKLMNYIRYWQASGESIKTSIRTKTRLGQIVQEGRFRGGCAPYGYRLEKQGRMNKKNHELYEIMVDEIEAGVVRKIFDLYLNRGYGSLRICRWLEEHGIRNRKGNNWTNATVQHMLKNNAYTGVLKSGETVSEVFPDLQIIDEQTFGAAQELLSKRSSSHKERTVPLNTRGSALLAGNVFCGHCGARLTLTTNGKKYIRKGDGGETVTPKIRYVCYNRTRHPHLCDGQTGYTSKKLDGMVEQIARHIFEQIKDCPTDELIEARYTKHLDECKAGLLRANQELKENSDELAEYEAEVIKALRGTSKFSPDLLNKLHAESAERTNRAKQSVSLCEAELASSEKRLGELQHEYSSLLSWAGIFDISSIEAKKMILTHIIRTIRVKRDYELDIELHISCEQFSVANSGSSKSG